MKTYGYYPGCSLEKNAIAYHSSTVEVANHLGISFSELKDWNCCGATEFMSVELLPAHALIGRNLAIAEQQLTNGKDLVAPCSACFLNLSKTNHYMAESAELAGRVNTALAAGGLHYNPGAVQVRHLLDIIINDIGLEKVAEAVQKPLYELKLAPYFGCLIVRPAFEGGWDDPEYPTSLDELLKVLGAKVVDYPMKAHCCGGHMTQISEEVSLELIRQLLKNADDYGADAIVTLCPMCQLNLDGYQDNVNQRFNTRYKMPILYFTQLMGLAFGIAPEKLGFGKEFVSARPALAKIREKPADDGKKKRKRRPPQPGLPMPQMPEENRS